MQFAGNLLAGRVSPASIARLLPVPVGVLALLLLLLGALLTSRVSALAGLVLLGGATFVVVPWVQTWLMGQVEPRAAGLAASVNISVAGVAGALGAGLGGAVLSGGAGLAWIGPVAAVPVLAAVVVATRLRRYEPVGPGAVTVSG